MSNQSPEQKKFLAWEKSTRDIIDFKKIYVDVAGGDVLAGLVLSEIMYWYLPDDRGNDNKTRIRKNGREWIACTRYDWWERTRMSPRVVDRALKVLVEKNILIKDVFRFAGYTTTHVSLNWDVFLSLFNSFIDTPAENPYTPITTRFYETVKAESPNGESGITKSDNPLTETTTETNKQSIAANAAQDTSPAKTSTDKKEKPRDVLFDLVATALFNIVLTDEWTIKANAPRIGKVVSYLKKKSATAEQVQRFIAWYRSKYPDVAMPCDVGKFSKHFSEFEQIQQKRVVPYPQQPTPLKRQIVTDAELDALLPSATDGMLIIPGVND